MIKIKVEVLVWDNQNAVHIQRHSVTKAEVEVAILNFVYHEQARSGRYLLVGRSGRRILSVILDRKSAKTYYVVTARDASKKERKKLKLYEGEDL